MCLVCCVTVPLTFIQYFFTRERVTEERRKAECEARGIAYIPPYELERQEQEELRRIAEENRIAELKEYCAKKGLDFDTENQKHLDKVGKKAAKKAAKKAKKAKK